MDINELYNNALKSHLDGRSRDAESKYDDILCISPNHVETLHMSAVLCAQLGRLDEAVRRISRAVELNPNNPRVILNCANICLAKSDLVSAQASFRKLTRLESCPLEGFHASVRFLLETQQYPEALDQIARGLYRFSGDAELYALRGRLLQVAESSAAALPDFSTALRLDPTNADRFNEFGGLLLKMERYQDAQTAFESAYRLQPSLASAASNVGVILHLRRDFSAALEWHQRALRADSHFAAGHGNLASTLRELGRFDEALFHYDIATSLDPEYADAHFNKALVYLQQGRFDVGWSLYEWRFMCSSLRLRMPVEQRSVLKSAEAIQDRVVVVDSEQGLGDILQFSRYLLLLARRNAKIVFRVPDRMVPVCRDSFCFADVIPKSAELPLFDLYCPLMSLPRIFWSSLGSAASDVPYIKTDIKKQVYWKSRLPSTSFNIGIAWQGSSGSMVDSGRSIPLEFFKKIAEIPGVRLFSLQRHTYVDQPSTHADRQWVTFFSDEMDAEGAFLDTGALMKSLDLVISSDTSIAHLAGALGIPVWVALKLVPDWRWLLNCADSPWYPSMRLFRQESADNWATVFSNLEKALRNQIADGRRLGK